MPPRKVTAPLLTSRLARTPPVVSRLLLAAGSSTALGLITTLLAFGAASRWSQWRPRTVRMLSLSAGAGTSSGLFLSQLPLLALDAKALHRFTHHQVSSFDTKQTRFGKEYTPIQVLGRSQLGQQAYVHEPTKMIFYKGVVPDHWLQLDTPNGLYAFPYIASMGTEELAEAIAHAFGKTKELVEIRLPGDVAFDHDSVPLKDSLGIEPFPISGLTFVISFMDVEKV